MPPKKDDKTKEKPECVIPAVVEPIDESSLEFYLVQIANLEEKVERYQKRLSELVKKEEYLHQQFHLVVDNKYKTIKKAEKKLSDKIAELKEYRRQIAELEVEIEKENAAFEENKQQIQLEHETTEKQLTDQNSALGGRRGSSERWPFRRTSFKDDAEDKVKELEYFKTVREELLKHIVELEQELVLQSETQKRDLEETDKKHILDRNKLKRDIANRLAERSEVIRQQFDAALPDTTRRLLLENYVINMRINSITEDMTELTRENAILSNHKYDQVDVLRRCRSEELEFARKNVAHSKMIQMLTGHRNELQSQLRESRSRKHPPTLGQDLETKRAELAKSRDQLKAYFLRNEQIEDEIAQSSDLLTERMFVRRRLEVTLHSVACTLKAAMAPEQDQECTDHDYLPVCQERKDFLSSVLQVLDTACRMDVGPTMADVVSPEHKISKLQRADRVISSLALVYQTGDLGLVPHTEFSIPTNLTNMKLIRSAREKEAKQKLLSRPKKKL